MKPAVFFDRDGTLIHDKAYLNDPEQVEFVPGAFEALKQLQQAGYLLIVVTNQSGIARGIVQVEKMHAIHERMQRDLATHGINIDEFFFSPHLDDSHPTRKPNPGMLLEAMGKFPIDKSKSWMVGDRMIDVEAGHRAGVRSILLGCKEDPANFSYAPPDFAGSLGEATHYILSHR